MRHATFRFYAELNDFLPEHRRHVRFVHHLEEGLPIGDIIESLGVPRTEIDLVLVNDASVDFCCLVQDGDRVTVYPVFEAFDISPVVRVRPCPLRNTCFVLAGSLGRLALYLRLLGFDTLRCSERCDEKLAAISAREGRIVLVSDPGVFERHQVTHGYWVRAQRPRDQLAEVVRRFDLQGQMAAFRRCGRCNTLLEPRDSDDVDCRVPRRAGEARDFFMRCPACAHSYRRGAHTERIRRLVQSMVERAR